MTTLNVILDDLLADSTGGAARYTGELARALIEHAPAGCSVEGIVASSTEDQYQEIADHVPGLAGLFKSALVRRDLTTAWQHGFTPVPTGMLHAPSLFAPLRSHDRVNERGNQIVVTIHDAVAFSHPDFMTSRELSWTKAMATRAVKYADAIVVPTHAVADELEGFLHLGDRMRVIGAAASSRLHKPADADARADRLGLPARYVATVGDSAARHGIGYLLTALAETDNKQLHLVVVGAEREAGALDAAIATSGVAKSRIHGLGALDDADYSTAVSGATALVHPTLANGFGLPMLEAFALGVPVIHAGTPSLVEIAGDAGVSIPVDDLAVYPALLTEAIDRVSTDTELRKTLSILGDDRARLFTWRAAAEGVWQLHADL
ncbi:MAG TPA: glycosyltransferase family 1 protein [Galbitalea sp.]|jgi:glycosyltransferase involved in cell wall biosynthesis|nr:glycosyltransferase family 1 protein [Galbitalea sp.]